MPRLQKYLAECGIASRRAAEKLIAAGRVTVNGAAAVIAQDVDPAQDAVSVDGRPVRPNDKIYIVLNKPEGTVTTAKDTHDRPTVLDCVTGVRARVFPVGRLDMDVEGVLLLTNDGELAFRLTHPRFEVEKVYLAWVYGCVTPQTALSLEKGVRLDDGISAPARAVILSSGQETTLLRLHLHEGRKREVKRMCAAAGHPVKTLHRVAFGNIQDKGLRPGEWRYLNEHEIEGLRQLVKL
ncbi:MAG: rRNA pseudouridine synthase [Candidatus Hydrogenedentes bacterium]|nr:rRNA pseudouridine synthase [Candidatus Hydrogenedentota bacterium]